MTQVLIKNLNLSCFNEYKTSVSSMKANEFIIK